MSSTIFKILRTEAVCCFNAAGRITATCRGWRYRTHFVKRVWRNGVTIMTRETSKSPFATSSVQTDPEVKST